MKHRALLLLLIMLMSLWLSSCDLDIMVDRALLLYDPVTFLGERQIQVQISGPDLEKVKAAGLDLDNYIAQTLRTTLPPAWEAAWSFEADTIILDFVLPFLGLDDYGMKVHGTVDTETYIDLAESASDSFQVSPPPIFSKQEQEGGVDIGHEIFTHEGDFLQAGIRGLATSYFEPVHHRIQREGNLLLYLSLGEPGHWTKADLHYLEVLPDLNFDAFYDTVRTDFADTFDSETDPKLRYGSDLFILGEQVYETEKTANQERILRQSRVLPLELEVATYSDDLLSFSRTLRLRLPQDAMGKSLLALGDRLNLGIIGDLSFQPESNPHNKIVAISSKVENVSLSHMRDYTRLLLGNEYEVELSEQEGSQFLWKESFELPAFFSDQPGPEIKLLGLFDAKLDHQSRTAQVELNVKRTWPAMALQTYWDKDTEVYVRRYHYYLTEGGTESILTDYLMDQSLEDYPIYSRTEDGHRHVFMQQSTPDPSVIAHQTSKLLGPTTIEFEETSGVFGKAVHWEESYHFNKISADQAIHLADGDSYQQLRQHKTMPNTGTVKLNLVLQSNLNLFLALGLLALLVATMLHPRSSLRAMLLKLKQRNAEYRYKKQLEIEERPLTWGATFEDHKGRQVKIISLEQPELEPRRRLRFRQR